MQGILKISSALDVSTSRSDDDFFDRLSHRYTRTLLVIFAVVLTTNQFVGNLINCWVPAHFSGSWKEYTNSYCWVKNTYWLPFHEYVPKDHENEKRQMIPYYQWVPIILLVMALGFNLPVMLWRSLNAQSGVDVQNLVESSECFQDAKNPKDTKKTLEYITNSIDRYLESHKNFNPACTFSLKHCISRALCFCCGRSHGNYLTTLYIFVKLFFFFNCLMQVLLLNVFMGHDYTSYGIDAIKKLGTAEEWPTSPRFPRVTMCDFKVRFLGNVQRYTVQCVLPINLFNEKVFLFIWVWIFFVMIASAIGGLIWVIRAIFSSDRVAYIKNHLGFKGQLDGANDSIIDTFTHKYLQQDGVFILRLIGHNTNAITVTDITCALFKKFQEKQVNEQEMKLLNHHTDISDGYYA